MPTITGHLSFSFIGHGVDNCLVANSETTPLGGVPLRRVLVLQHRTTRDLPYTKWPMGWLRPWIAADYLLIGSSSPEPRPSLDPGGAVNQTLDEMGVLKGECIVIPHHDDKTLRGHAKAAVRTIQLSLAKFSDGAPKGVAVDINSLDQEIRKSIADAEARQVQLIRADYELHRTGEFRLRMSRTPPMKGAPQGSQAARTYEEILARQIYYFAKDVAHRHYHHEPSADNLLPLVKATASDDQTWRRETLWALSRAVLEVRRRDQLSDYKGAIGMLAYAEAFQSLLARVMRDPSGTFVPVTQIVPYDFCHTRSSLEAKIEERAWIASGWSQFWTLLVTTVLAASALWIGAVQIRDTACEALSPRAESVSSSYQIEARATGAVPTLPGATEGGQPARLAVRFAEIQPPPPSTPCAGLGSPPSWAAAAVLGVISDPARLIGLLALASLFYFEFARRSLRSVRASRFLVSSPWEWLTALGGSVSRRVRLINPLWGDRVGRLVAIGGAATLLGLLGWAFAALL